MALSLQLLCRIYPSGMKHEEVCCKDKNILHSFRIAQFS